MKALTISVRTHITHERIADLLDSASRGSAYWAEGVDVLGYESIVKGVIECTAYNCDSHQVKIKDIESDEAVAIYVLNLAKIKRGLTVMAKKYPKHFADFLTENDDADTADVFLQCALLGEVVYG